MLWSVGSNAEIYKWVDDNGVTHYAGTPPATGKARKLDPATLTVSVYQAPPKDEQARKLAALQSQRIARLEQQLQAERLARLSQQASHRSDAELAREQCLKERRVDCDSGRDGVPASPTFFTVAAPTYAIARPRAFVPPLRNSHPAPAFGPDPYSVPVPAFGPVPAYLLNTGRATAHEKRPHPAR